MGRSQAEEKKEKMQKHGGTTVKVVTRSNADVVKGFPKNNISVTGGKIENATNTFQVLTKRNESN